MSKNKGKNFVFILGVGMILTGCHAPLSFWEDEIIKIAEDVVQEEKDATSGRKTAPTKVIHKEKIIRKRPLSH